MSATPEPSSLVPPDVIERCLALLRLQPAGLVTDIDGTISAIAPTPGAAIVTDEIRVSLSRLARRLALVGAVSGRAAATAATMIGLPELVYVGNHGMERLHQGDVWQNPEAAAAIAAVAAAVTDVEAAMEPADAEWSVIENKGVSATIHYRLAPDADLAQAKLLPAITAAAARHGLIVTEGRLIFEIRPNVRINKGTALVDLVAAHKLRGLVFLGDDLTDVDGFLALQRLRAEGKLAGLAVGVLGAESHPRVREAMDVGLPGVPAVAELLDRLSQAMDSTSE